MKIHFRLSKKLQLHTWFIIETGILYQLSNSGGVITVMLFDKVVANYEQKKDPEFFNWMLHQLRQNSEPIK